MITTAQALDLIAQNRLTPPSETVPLRQSLGRQLAAPQAARLTQPAFAASAMDGYAVRLADVGKIGARLRVIGEAPAGKPFAGGIKAFEAVRLFTGSVIPQGANSVIIQEDVTRADDFITVDAPQSAARHIRKAGIDFKAGDEILAAGRRIGAPEIAVLASAGHENADVRAKLKVAILSGGDELLPLGAVPETGQIINSNPYALAALIESWGHSAEILPAAKDTKESLSIALKQAASADIIVPVGGASVGDHDHMRAVFKDAGLEMIFEKVAVRPGKPTWFGWLAAQIVLGLPGNPASALVCAQLFLKPLLCGQDATFIAATLAADIGANGPRESYLRAVANLGPDGRLSVTPMPKQDSSLMTPFLRANCLLKRPAHAAALTSGEMASIMVISEIS